MFPGFASLYRSYQLHIDETYYDLCLALEKPLPKGNKIAEVKPLLTEIESVLGGSIVLDSGRFSLLKKGGDSKKGGDFEISLVAEGFRKLGALAKTVNFSIFSCLSMASLKFGGYLREKAITCRLFAFFAADVE